MNNQSSFDRFLHLGDTAENYDMDTEMLEAIGISPDIYEKAGLLTRCPIPFSIDCLTCDESAEIMVRHDELVAICPNCGIFHPYEEQLKWWTPCYAPVLESLYKGFECTEETECLIPNILWKLGRCALAGQSRVIYVARGINSEMNDTIVGKLPENRTSLLFVFGSLPEKGMCGSFDADKVFSVNSLVTLDNTEFRVDTEPVVRTLEVLNMTCAPAVRGPGKYSKIGDLREKIKKLLSSFMHGVYCEKEQYERTGHPYVFKKLTQVEIAECFNVSAVMVNRAINNDPFVKGLYMRACNPTAAYNYGKSIETGQSML